MNEEIKPENVRIHSRADELIACLEGEIAKRDEVIVGLTNSCDFWREKAIAADDELAAIKAQGVVMPEGWIPLTIEHEPGYPEDVAFGPKRMMDRLKKWLDRYFEMRLNAAPVQQVSVPASAFASRAITHYEAALLAAFPSGSSGEVFNQWNEARRVLAAAPAAPAADAGHVFYGMDGNHP